MNNIKKLLFGISFALISLMSCGKQIPNSFDFGTIANNTYTNTYFGFSMAVPSGWNVQTSEEMKAMSNLGKELMAGEDKHFKKQIDAAEINVANLFTAFQFELGETTGYNPSVVINAENISKTPIKTGADYLNAARKTLARSQMSLQPTSSNERIVLGGKEFSYFSGTLDVQGIAVQQRYYSSVINNFSLNIVLNYQTEAELERLLEVLKTLQFN